MTSSTLAPVQPVQQQDPNLLNFYSADTLTHWVNARLVEIFPQPYPQFYPSTTVQFRSQFNGRQANWAGEYSNCGGHITLNLAAFTPLRDKPQELHRALRSVLLHELCHHVQRWQAIREGVPISPPHGAVFRGLMRFVNGFYNEEIVSVYHALRMRSTCPKTHRRALALLALTTSANEHEAALAAARFAELQLRYELDLSPEAGAMVEGLPPMDDQVIHIAKQASTWLRYLLGAIAETNSCKLYWHRQDGSVAFHLVGRETKIAQAYEVMEYLIEAIDRAVNKERVEAKASGSPARSGRSYFMAFREGVAATVYHSLKARHAERLKDGIVADNKINHIPGLVLQAHFKKEQAALEEFLRGESYRFRSTTAGGSRSAYGKARGREAGAAIGLDPQVRSSRRLALTGG
jgi:predicted SprT family Zn-dependent metalloprotease